MSKSLVLGNGSILVCLDHYGQVSDFYFPYVGLENHIGFGREHKIGVFVDGRISWLNEPAWNIQIEYEAGTMISKIFATNDDMNISLEFQDVVYNETNIFLRRVLVKNNEKKERQIKVYFSQQFVISGAPSGNTAYVTKDQQKIIHYKGRRNFLVSGCVGSKGGGKHPHKPFDQYSVGLSGIENREGTWRDAEDGELSKNAIEHGSVDSVIGFTLDIPRSDYAEIYYWVTAAETFADAEKLHLDIKARLPKHFIKSTGDYWKAWLEKREFVFEGLSKKVSDLFKTSLLVVRAHSDNGGAIIASGDSHILQYGRDTYSYVWPRDGAFAALALTKSGYFHTAERFFSFCNEVITPEGFLLHKYNADKSFGSSWHPWVSEGEAQLAIQEDEVALILVMLWEHYELTKDLEFIEKLYNSLIKRAANFIVEYRDSKTGLPTPSYDLWEERHGIHCFTTAVVYGALKAATNFAAVLGKESDAGKYANSASEVKEALVKHFWNEEKGYFSRSIWKEGKDFVSDDTIDASSAYGIFRFGILPVDDERLKKTYEKTVETLSKNINIGGMARYDGDRYYKRYDNVPGNPWFISTLWYVEYLIAKAKEEKDLEEVKSKLEWVASQAKDAGMLSEQIDPHTGENISVSPLTWSHARFILAVVAYLEKLEKLGICKTCYPVIKTDEHRD